MVSIMPFVVIRCNKHFGGGGEADWEGESWIVLERRADVPLAPPLDRTLSIENFHLYMSIIDHYSINTHHYFDLQARAGLRWARGHGR